VRAQSHYKEKNGVNITSAHSTVSRYLFKNSHKKMHDWSEKKYKEMEEKVAVEMLGKSIFKERHRRQWTVREVRAVEEYYPTISSKKIAKLLRRSQQAIRIMAYKLGIKKSTATS